MSLLAFALLTLSPPSVPGGDERAHVRKLNGPLPAARVGDVLDARVAPGERWIVYRADATLDGRFELYSVPADGSAPPRALCGLLEPDRHVDEYVLTPDGERVVYHTFGANFTKQALHVAPLDASTPPVLLTERVPAWTEFRQGFQVGPDSRRVLFHADLLTDRRQELFTVPLDGSTPPVRIHAPFTAGFLGQASFTPDSARVVFQVFDGTSALYVAPVEGGALTRLTDPMVERGGVLQFRVAPDGARVVYLADAFVDEQVELFSVSIDGGAALLLSPPLLGGGRVDLFELDAASARAVYRVRSSTSALQELHSVPIDGTPGDVRLDAAAFAPGVTGELALTAAGRVLFLARPSTQVFSALHSAPIDGSAPAVQLGGVRTSTSIGAFVPAPDGERVAYVRNFGSSSDVFATACDGSSPEVRLDDGLFDIYTLDTLRVNVHRAVYVARTLGGPRRLYSARLDGTGRTVVLLEPAPPLGDLELELHLAGDAAIARTDWSEDGLVELVRVALDGRDAPTSLSGPGALTTVGDVQRFALAGRRVLFQAHGVDGRAGLFVAELDRGGPPRRIDAPLASGNPLDGVLSFELAPDESRVVFRVRSAGHSRLFLAPLDGRTPPRELDPPLTLPGEVDERVLFTPDGRWILFVDSGRGGAQKDLFLVPSDASAPARSLFTFQSFGPYDYRLLVSPDSRRVVFAADFVSFSNNCVHSLPIDPLVGAASLLLPNYSGDVTDVAITPDSQRVVFRADAVSDERYLLYSWPLDGSTGLVALIPPRSGGAKDFALAPDGRVVFRSLQPGDHVDLELVPADGSVPPAKLAVLPPGRRVLEFLLAPDGSRVLYRADSGSEGRHELFSRPLDGSAPVVRLSYASRKDTDVSTFAFTPDSRLVLFLADTLRNEQDDLYVVPADRSWPPRRLNPSLAPHGTLFDFECSPDGAFVAYRANHHERALVELFRVPIAGGAEPVQLSAPLVFGGDVRGYAFVTPGELVYDADQREDNAHELFASFLGELRRPSGPPRPLR